MAIGSGAQGHYGWSIHLGATGLQIGSGVQICSGGQGMMILAAGWLSRGAWSGTPGGSGRSVHLEALLSQWWGWACGLGRAAPPSGHDRSWFGALGQGCSPQDLPKEDPVDLPE